MGRKKNGRIELWVDETLKKKVVEKLVVEKRNITELVEQSFEDFVAETVEEKIEIEKPIKVKKVKSIPVQEKIVEVAEQVSPNPKMLTQRQKDIIETFEKEKLKVEGNKVFKWDTWTNEWKERPENSQGRIAISGLWTVRFDEIIKAFGQAEKPLPKE